MGGEEREGCMELCREDGGSIEGRELWAIPQEEK
jgi:hypothetical protein